MYRLPLIVSTGLLALGDHTDVLGRVGKYISRNHLFTLFRFSSFNNFLPLPKKDQPKSKHITTMRLTLLLTLFIAAAVHATAIPADDSPDAAPTGGQCLPASCVADGVSVFFPSLSIQHSKRA